MSNEYSIDVRRRARRMWLSGRYSDAQIAAELKLPRADTIRDWRNAEDWRPLADDMAKVLDQEVEARLRAKSKESSGVSQQLAQVVEAVAVRHLKNPMLSPRDLKAISGALLNAQRMREKATNEGAEKEQKFITSVAELFRRERDHKNRLSLNRCRDHEGAEDSAVKVPADPHDPLQAVIMPPAEAGPTATRGV